MSALRGAVVVMTGASSGLGRAAAIEFAGGGATVVPTDVTRDDDVARRAARCDGDSAGAPRGSHNAPGSLVVWTHDERASSHAAGYGALMPALRPLAQDLWIAERPQSFFGLEVGARMTVMRLANGRLLLHSPLPLDAPLRAELDALGPVSYAVAPSRVHHLYAGDVATAYPDARLWIAPGLETKRPDLRYEAILGDEAPEEWRGEVEQTFFRGRPFENEVAFFHRASRSLITCDLAFNFRERTPMSTRLLMSLIGSYGYFGPTKIDWLLIRDRAKARASLERILAWDFDRAIVAHGDVQETGARALLRDGYAWLLRD